MSVSIIIPVLNEEDTIKTVLEQFKYYRQQGHEVIVVDGGSEDNTISIAQSLADTVIKSQPGRAIQMNTGAKSAKFNVLWFLHADTLIPEHAIESIQDALNKKGYNWGWFKINLSGTNMFFRVIESMMNMRSCISGVATGDQGIFVKKTLFDNVKGYSVIPLMEDVDLSKKLKKQSKHRCLKERLTTSSRRWEKNGIFSTMLLMWRLRLLYWLGVSADKLARQYR